MKTKLKRGFLISIEGIDGSGKSILCTKLNEYLSKKYSVILTKEPGGSEVGKDIREILQYKKVCPLSEYLLYAADRAQHFNELVIPALKAKKIVLSDRMGDSSIAFQGYGRKIDINLIESVNDKAMTSIKPDLTIYLKIDIETAKKRVENRNIKLTVMEQEKIDFTKKVMNGFNKIFRNKNNVIVIDAKQSQEKVLEETLKVVEKWIEKNLI